MPEPTKAQLATRVKALEKALKRETAARQRADLGEEPARSRLDLHVLLADDPVIGTRLPET